jgi:hypothetical protein
MSRNNFYGRRTEPDMRFELDATLRGIFPEIPKAQILVFRQMQRDNYKRLIPCACVDAVTHEPDKDTFCPLCEGEGHYWNEVLVEGYRHIIATTTGFASQERQLPTGLINLPMMNFYTRHNKVFTIDDRLIELYLDAEGVPEMPYRRKQLYTISSALDFRSDYGRLEYWRLSCYAEKRKFLNGIEGL